MSSVAMTVIVALAVTGTDGAQGLPGGEFRWTYGAPVVEARAVEGVEFISVKDHAFASMRNVTPKGQRWTGVVSHIEFLRSGCDERLDVDPANLRFLFQGVLEKDHQAKPYGEIPWNLGLLEPAE